MIRRSPCQTFARQILTAATLILGFCTAASGAAAQTNRDIETPLPAGPISEWSICNDASYVLRIATSYSREDGLTTKGWSDLLPGQCRIESVPLDSPRFLFAESLALHRGGIREWKGRTALCIAADDFETDITEDCDTNDLTARDFLSVRPGEPETRLHEPGRYSPETAQVAVLQRLLRDAGYPISRIDGLAGRATARLLRQFKLDAELDAATSGEPLILALMARVQEANLDVGLEVCNDSSRTVWSALATRQSGNWRSRGWWKTQAGACTKIMSRPLPGTEAHVYAIQDQEDGPDKRLRSIATGPTQFCISEAQFNALGNELCVEQGYAIASFRAVPTDADGARMRLTDADFSAPNPNGLRR